MAPHCFPRPWNIGTIQNPLLSAMLPGKRSAFYFEDEAQRQMSMKRLSLHWRLTESSYLGETPTRDFDSLGRCRFLKYGDG